MASQRETAKPRWATGRGFIINCREQKLQFFYAGVTGAIKCAHQFPFSNRKAMAEVIGLGDAQLEGAKDNRDRLSLAALEALAKYFGFDHPWTEFRNGTNEEFARRYNAENCFQPSSAPLRRKSAAAMFFSGRGRNAQVPSKIPGLTSILGVAAKYGQGRADFGFEVSCGTPLLTVIAGPRSGAGMSKWIAERRFCCAKAGKGSGSPLRCEPSMAAGRSAGMRLLCKLRVVGRSGWAGQHRRPEVSPDFATVEALAPAASSASVSASGGRITICKLPRRRSRLIMRRSQSWIRAETRSS